MLVNGQMVNPVEWWDAHWVADRVGRKRALILAVTWFSLFSLLNAMAWEPVGLFAALPFNPLAVVVELRGGPQQAVLQGVTLLTHGIDGVGCGGS